MDIVTCRVTSFNNILKGVFIMQKNNQTLDSREVAEMVEKDHAMLLRDIRRYFY